MSNGPSSTTEGSGLGIARRRPLSVSWNFGGGGGSDRRLGFRRNHGLRRDLRLELGDHRVDLPVARERPIELVLLDGLELVAAREVDVGQGLGGDEVARIRDEHLREGRDRVRRLPRFQVHAPQGHLRRHVAGVSEQALLERGERVLQAAELPVLLGERDEQARARIQIQAPLEIADAGFGRLCSHGEKMPPPFRGAAKVSTEWESGAERRAAVPGTLPRPRPHRSSRGRSRSRRPFRRFAACRPGSRRCRSAAPDSRSEP